MCPRFCIDYREMNSRTQTEAFLMPPIQHALQNLGNAKVLSSIDMVSGYWKIPVSAQSRKYTAFSTPDGAPYRFKVMPFGLKNGPASFQRLMTQQVFVGYLHKFPPVYLDDNIVVFSCDWPVPTNKKELQQYLGLTNWLREYIPQFTDASTPLTGKARLDWNQTHQTAFDTLKRLLGQSLQLKRPRPDKPFFLQTDASQHDSGSARRTPPIHAADRQLGNKRAELYAEREHQVDETGRVTARVYLPGRALPRH